VCEYSSEELQIYLKFISSEIIKTRCHCQISLHVWQMCEFFSGRYKYTEKQMGEINKAFLLPLTKKYSDEQGG